MIRLTGGFSLAVPPQWAFHYFTPLGEREWVPGWDPRFPAPQDETVFETGHGQQTTTWVMVDSTPGERIRYARVAHGLTAGTVEVNLMETADGGHLADAVEHGQAQGCGRRCQWPTSSAFIPPYCATHRCHVSSEISNCLHTAAKPMPWPISFSPSRSLRM